MGICASAHPPGCRKVEISLGVLIQYDASGEQEVHHPIPLHSSRPHQGSHILLLLSSWVLWPLRRQSVQEGPGGASKLLLCDDALLGKSASCVFAGAVLLDRRRIIVAAAGTDALLVRARHSGQHVEHPVEIEPQAAWTNAGDRRHWCTPLLVPLTSCGAWRKRQQGPARRQLHRSANRCSARLTA